jgi:NAD(P)H-flavin reductase
MNNERVPVQFRINKVWRETSDTFTFQLNGTCGGTFLPGQFNMLSVFGVGEVPLSISGNPLNQEQTIHTVRSVGTVTNALSKMRAGDSVGLRGPFGIGWPVQTAEGNDVVILAGGIGLAPLRPVIYQILNRREKYGKVVILYGTRSPEDILFRRELEKWRSRFDLQVEITVDHAFPGWQGNVGVVTALIQRATFDPQNCIAMVCGPEIMMYFSALELLARGLDPTEIYLSMERNMKCGTAFCGHCQFGPHFICKDGPVFSYDRIRDWLAKGEI